jgi:hypothetical protein
MAAIRNIGIKPCMTPNIKQSAEKTASTIEPEFAYFCWLESPTTLLDELGWASELESRDAIAMSCGPASWASADSGSIAEIGPETSFTVGTLSNASAPAVPSLLETPTDVSSARQPCTGSSFSAGAPH